MADESAEKPLVHIPKGERMPDNPAPAFAIPRQAFSFAVEDFPDGHIPEALVRTVDGFEFTFHNVDRSPPRRLDGTYIFDVEKTLVTWRFIGLTNDRAIT